MGREGSRVGLYWVLVSSLGLAGLNRDRPVFVFGDWINLLSGMAC